MPNTTSEQEFLYYTAKAGDIARQLGFAGLAVVWLFHTAPTGAPDAVSVGLAEGFKCPIQLIVISLGIDAVQYLLGSTLWGVAYKTDPTGDAYQNKGWNIAAILVTVALIAAKLILMAAAYSLLFQQLQSSVLWQ